MEVLATPVVTVSALSLIVILLIFGFFIMRARTLRLERQMLDMQKVLVDSLTKASDDSRSATEALTQQALNEILESRQEVSKFVGNTIKNLEASLSGLIQASELKSIENIKDNATDIKSTVEQLEVAISKDLASSKSSISERFDQMERNISESESSTLSRLDAAKQETLDNLEQASKNQIQRIVASITESNDRSRDDLRESEKRLSGVIDRLRVSNISTENKNLYGQGRLVIETDSFVKTFDCCQLSQLEDKETGLVTKNEYKNGSLIASKTYRTDRLEYIGHYEDGVLLEMEDHTESEGIVTKYEYNEAGEIESIE